MNSYEYDGQGRIRRVSIPKDVEKFLRETEERNKELAEIEAYRRAGIITDTAAVAYIAMTNIHRN